jgi:hypothetical protein
MIDPKYMCDRHLLGEHLECHMFAGCIDKHKSLTGYVKGNLFDAASLTGRHNALAGEMGTRGFSHRSPLAEYAGESTPIDNMWSLNELLARCSRCRTKWESGHHVTEGHRPYRD